MEPIEQLKLLYEQLFKINEEILTYLEKGWDNEATFKTIQFQQLSEQINSSKTGINLSETEKQEIAELDKKALDIISSITNKMANLKNNIQKDLTKIKNTIKVNSAYTPQAPQGGQIIDEHDEQD